MLNFIHLSDIHFMKDSGGHLDLDLEIRSGLLDDAERVSAKLGEPVHGLLITGDIAYAGKDDEYARASEWLEQLCDRVGCSRSNIWCVPGNHDVDRDVVRARSTIRTLHSEIRANVNCHLQTHLRDEEACAALLAPLKAYSETFAGDFDCDLTIKRPWWKDDVPLPGGAVLRLVGLNSTLVSDEHDSDQNEATKLCLGAAQVSLGRVAGCVMVTLSHHPPSWLIDGEGVRRSLRNYAQVQLYGHKHEHDIYREEQSVVVCAGAMHPERRDPDWIPRYNLIGFDVTPAATDNWSLNVDIRPRAWDDRRKKFVPYPKDDDSNIWDYRCSFLAPIKVETTAEIAKDLPQDAQHADESPKSERTEPVVNIQPHKVLTHRFLKLEHYKRTNILKAAGLFVEPEINETEHDVYRRSFARAREEGKLALLWDAVNAEFSEPERLPNPFMSKG